MIIFLTIYIIGLILSYGVELYKEQRIDERVVFDSILLSTIWPIMYIGKFIMFSSKIYLRIINFIFWRIFNDQNRS